MTATTSASSGGGLRVAVLISGEGTNLQALLERAHGRDGVEVVAVASSRSDARGLGRARRAGVETGVFSRDGYAAREERDAALARWLDERGVELVVLAGFMELLGPAVIERYEGRVINVHPSLLPAFPGLGAIRQALSYGVRVMGVTVHFVDAGVDTGPIIAQQAFAVPYAAPIDAVEGIVHDIEHEILPRTVRLFARGAVGLDPANPRRVLLDVPDALPEVVRA